MYVCMSVCMHVDAQKPLAWHSGLTGIQQQTFFHWIPLWAHLLLVITDQIGSTPKNCSFLLRCTQRRRQVEERGKRKEKEKKGKYFKISTYSWEMQCVFPLCDWPWAPVFYLEEHCDYQSQITFSYGILPTCFAESVTFGENNAWVTGEEGAWLQLMTHCRWWNDSDEKGL